MEALVVGALTGGGAVVGASLWMLRVRPDMLLGHGHRQVVEHDRAAVLLALRVTAGVLVFLLGFLTGLALTFLPATAGG